MNNLRALIEAKGWYQTHQGGLVYVPDAELARFVAIETAARDLLERSPIDVDGETQHEWCHYCDSFDETHREWCDWALLSNALATEIPE